MKKISIIIFVISFAINSIGQCQILKSKSEQDFKDYFIKNISTLDPIEGIWSYSQTVKIYHNNVLADNKSYPQTCKFGITKDKESYCFASPIGSVSQIIPSVNTFKVTASAGVYLFSGTYWNFVDNIKMEIPSTNAKAIITPEGILKYSYEVPESVKNKIDGDSKVTGITVFIEVEMIKVFPLSSDIIKSIPSTGTGFAISSNGYIATCNHVIDGAKSIKVKGIGGNFNKSYSAKVISADVNNDIAIIKIDDATFTTFGTIPYTIKTPSSDVGSSIFILGYPLTATMGEEIKLTDGLISAKSGFMGDITSYQISAAAQPGNSGGPLFNKIGNLIGIVNARHVEAENATYAVKSSYLVNLIESLTTSPKLQTVNNLTGKTLTDQVKLIKNFVFIIEVN